MDQKDTTRPASPSYLQVVRRQEAHKPPGQPHAAAHAHSQAKKHSRGALHEQVSRQYRAEEEGERAGRCSQACISSDLHLPAWRIKASQAVEQPTIAVQPSGLLLLHKRGGSAEPDRPAPSCHTHAPTPPAPRTTGQPTQCRMTGAYPGLQHGPGSQVLLLHLAIGHQGTKDAQPFLAEAAPEVSQQILQAQSSADEGQRCWHAQCQCTWVCLVMDNRVSSKDCVIQGGLHTMTKG